MSWRHTSSKMMKSYASSFDHKVGYFTAEDDYKNQLESITSHKIYTYHKDHLNKCYCEDCCRIKDYEHAKCECLCYGNNGLMKTIAIFCVKLTSVFHTYNVLSFARQPFTYV